MPNFMPLGSIIKKKYTKVVDPLKSIILVYGGRILWKGGVLIFSYLILIHQLDDLGGLCDNFGSDFIGCRFVGPPIACKRGLRLAS